MNTINSEKFSQASAGANKALRPRFRSGLLPQTPGHTPEMEAPDSDEIVDMAQFSYKSSNPFAFITRMVKPALIAWTIVAGLYFTGSIFFFQPATALSDGFKTFSDNGRPELDVAFEYAAAGRHFKGDENVADSADNRQKFAPGSKIGIFYNPISANDYETDRNDKFALAVTPAWVLFGWIAAPFLNLKKESTPLVLPRRNRRQTVSQ